MAVMEDQTIAMSEVVLRDFDGTKTIYPAKMPLPELISNSSMEDAFSVTRHYARTDQQDEQGRTVYVERN